MGDPGGEEVRFPGPGGEGRTGRFALPPEGRPCPAVVVVPGDSSAPEFVGVLLRRIAAEGFAVLVPDPGSGTAAGLAAASAWLGTRPEVRPGAVGVLGVSGGGSLAFDLACAPGTAVRACVDFYGPLRPGGTGKGIPARVADLRCPVLAVFGGSDDRIDLRDVLSLRDALAARGRGHAIAYPRAAHGFLDPASPTHREADAADAWRRALLFLREHLAPDTLPENATPSVPQYRPRR